MPGNNEKDEEMADADLFLPPEDKCAHGVYHCGLPIAAHTGWRNGGPHHDFVPPNPKPRPDRIASSFIQTEWTCTHCGEECDVWGVADNEWMECSKCGRESYVLSFANDDQPGASDD